VLAGGGALIAIAALFGPAAMKPSMDVLFAELQPQDAAAIVERLEAMNVPYELINGGNAITVPADRVHNVRLTLASEGIPNGGTVGYELFDAQQFGESEFAQQVKLVRAKEGELVRTISSLRGVERARVHLVLP